MVVLNDGKYKKIITFQGIFINENSADLKKGNRGEPCFFRTCFLALETFVVYNCLHR